MAAAVAAMAGAALAVSGSAGAVGEEADISIAQLAPGPYTVGSSGIITVVVTNNGPGTITEAIVPGGAPTGATLNSVSPSQGACAKGRNTVYTCNFGAIAPGSSARASVSVTFGTPGTVTSQASLQIFGATDPDLTNNVSRQSMVVASGPVDIGLSARTSPGSPDPGTMFAYQLTVKNGDKTGAEGAYVDLTLPAEVTYVGGSSSTGELCSLADGVAHCPIGTIVGGGQATVTVNVIAPDASKVAMTASAFAGHSSSDPKPTNNSVIITTSTR
jgi:hypothetical protein